MLSFFSCNPYSSCFSQVKYFLACTTCDWCILHVIREVVCVLHIPTQDPVKEKEAEMILDCFEKFNKVRMCTELTSYPGHVWQSSTEHAQYSLIPRLSRNANICIVGRAWYLFYISMTIKIGPKQKANILRVVQPTMLQHSVYMIFDA